MIPDALKQERHVGTWFTLDTNRINARQKDEGMNQLEKWADSKVIDLILSEPASREIAQGWSADRISKSRKYFTTLSMVTTTEERRVLRSIAHIVLGREPITLSERGDVEILFNAWKYPGGLITEDGASRSQPGGILGAREQLKSLGITVFRTKEAVDFVRNRIRNRDRRATGYAQEYNDVVPEWVGMD